MPEAKRTMRRLVAWRGLTDTDDSGSVSVHARTDGSLGLEVGNGREKHANANLDKRRAAWLHGLLGSWLETGELKESE